MKKAAVFRLYPTADQKHYLAGLFGAVRFCYNKGLELKKHYYKVKGVNLHPIHDLKKLLPIAKKSQKYSSIAITTVWPCRESLT